MSSPRTLIPLRAGAALDETCDVLVVGAGAAGICAALEANAAGAEVRVLERLEEAGGSSAASSGQLYLGGGTALQKACGFEDTPDDLYRYLVASCGPGADEEKCRTFADGAVEHYEWLVAHDVPFKPTFVPHTVTSNPPGDDGLTYTGSELCHRFRDVAAPAPRGHNVQHEGSSGVRLMQGLLSEARRAGIEIRTGSRASALLRSPEGAIAGVEIETPGGVRRVGARRGVVLTTGGFHHDREMLARYAPRLLPLFPIGLPSEDGSGIRLGMAAGGDVMGMEAGGVILSYTKPRKLIKGILVDASGQRFVSEDLYQAVHGDASIHAAGGHCFCIADAEVFGDPVMDIPVIGPCDTVEALEAKLELPVGSLERTLAVYNRDAARGEDPVFHKAPEWLEPLDRPPFYALDLRTAAFPYPFFTLGGLRTTPHGEVLDPEGGAIPGLFAAGRTTSGLCARGYSSGISLSDCTFFGRAAGRAAAARR